MHQVCRYPELSGTNPVVVPRNVAKLSMFFENQGDHEQSLQCVYDHVIFSDII